MHEDTCHHRPLTVGSYNGQRCGNVITIPAMHNSMHIPVQGMHTIQARPWAIHCRLAIMTQPWRENKDRDMRPKHKCQCDRDSRGPASGYINTWYTRSNSKRCTAAKAKGIYHKGLATYKRICGTRHTKIMAHQAWVGHDRWHGCKRQVSNNTISIADADIETATHEPHGNWEDKVACTWNSVLGKYECWYRKCS